MEFLQSFFFRYCSIYSEIFSGIYLAIPLENSQDFLVEVPRRISQEFFKIFLQRLLRIIQNFPQGIFQFPGMLQVIFQRFSHRFLQKILQDLFLSIFHGIFFLFLFFLWMPIEKPVLPIIFVKYSFFFSEFHQIFSRSSKGSCQRFIQIFIFFLEFYLIFFCYCGIFFFRYF